jgi:hypothetical protein
MPMLLRHALSLSVAVTLLAGCGGSQGTFAPPSAPNAGAPAVPVQRLPRASGEVQYFTSYGSTGAALEFDYPKSKSPIGEITGLSSPSGECSKGSKTFWITQSNEVAEYKAGGTAPIETHDTGAGACAVDPATGDLALVTQSGIVIFKPGSNSGKTFSPPFEAYFAGYDSSGNLYVDGVNAEEAAVAELPKGKDTFELLTLNNTIGFPGAVQWDGKYITVGDQEASDVYDYSCAGTSCTLKRTVSLTGAGDCTQTWIAQPYLYCPDAGNEDFAVYKYPQGGSAIAMLSGGSYLPLGAVSLRAR